MGRLSWAAMFLFVAVAATASAQATSTFNGRVLDQGDAVLPGVTVTATNTSTGVMRTTVTNAEGAVLPPGARPRRLRRQDGTAGIRADGARSA